MKKPVKKNRSYGTGNEHRRILFRRLQITALAFLALGFVLLMERSNVRYTEQKEGIPILEASRFLKSEPGGNPEKKAECLVLYQSSDNSSVLAAEEFEAVLDEMKVRYERMDIQSDGRILWDRYDKITVVLSDLSWLGEELFTMMDWAKEGGSLLFAQPMTDNGSLQLVYGDLGIRENGGFGYVDTISFETGLMIGGYGKNYTITDPFDSSMSVILEEGCTVHITAGGMKRTPLLWERECGDGKVVVMNLGIFEKAYRGFYAAAYSLLGDVCVYPVINGSVFYLDDFPSPVPSGNGEYIKRDYGTDIQTFYSNVWWPNIQGLSTDYGIRFTGLAIEDYSDDTQAPLPANGDTYRFVYFGNMLLSQGGEIGFHGYNHMPLCLETFDNKSVLDYEKWPSEADMAASLTELERFCTELFKREEFQVYVPPSNILSEEGRKLIGEKFPEIRAIASIYFPGTFEYTQDFRVAEDGVIETPRVISGCLIDSYMEIAALSELNLHYINSHFQHPDDVLDEDRGASLGWKALYARLREYVDWLYQSAPDIRNLTGSEMAAAVQRYYYADPLIEEEDGTLVISLDSFADEAWLFVRMNEGKPGNVTGGVMTEAADRLYLLKAESDRIVIEKEGT